MRKLIALPAGAALVAAIALPGGAVGSSDGHRGHQDKRAEHRGGGHHGGSDRGRCGKERRMEKGYEVILDGSRRCFEQWRYTGGASMTLQRDGTVRSGPGEPGLGVLWYKARPYGDFSLRLQFRDDSPVAEPPGQQRRARCASRPRRARFPAARRRSTAPSRTTTPGSRSTAGTRSRSTTRPTAATTIRARPARSTASPTSTARPPSRPPPVRGTTSRSPWSASTTR